MEKIIDENKQGSSLELALKPENTKKLFIESYGCQMNFSDSEIVASILQKEGFNTTSKLEDADLVLVNTCSIRDKAEQTVRKRLEKYNAVKRQNPKMKVGVLGCMAERLKSKFLEEEKIVDLVVGPDAYKDLPNLIAEVEEGRNAVNVILSKDETYGDIAPVSSLGQFIASLIMILGYGIIAIPTGIVTSEMTKSQRNKIPKNTQSCTNCMASYHTDDAEFCHKCGELLNHE